MKNNSFAVFIISHGRSDKMKTLETLRKFNYTGKWYIIIDNEDKTADKYYKNFGQENVIVFDKLAIAQTVDNGDNFENYRSTTHARNACFNIAEELGIKYFLVLDDDYTAFTYKFDGSFKYVGYKPTKSLDRIFDIVLDFYIATPAITSIAFAQGGDFFGGETSITAEAPGLKRKCMNSFFCSVERRFTFFSRLNEDVNTYITLGSRGHLFLTMTNFGLQQAQTQTTKGGMSEAYLDGGTYVKSFYSVMYCPSFMKVMRMNSKNARIHHLTDWNSAVPKILDEKYKKDVSTAGIL